MIGDKAIFVVDDDPAIRHSLQRLLTAHGFHPETFDSAEALSASENAEGLCLVLDINLSGALASSWATNWLPLAAHFRSSS